MTKLLFSGSLCVYVHIVQVRGGFTVTKVPAAIITRRRHSNNKGNPSSGSEYQETGQLLVQSSLTATAVSEVKEKVGIGLFWAMKLYKFSYPFLLQDNVGCVVFL